MRLGLVDNREAAMGRADRTLTRRTILGAALAGALVVPPPVRATPSYGPAAMLRERATSFLAALAPEKRRRATFPFGGDVWRDWNYFFQARTRFIKPGLRLEEMSVSERDLAWDVAAAMLSPRGLEKARIIMLQQAYLASLNRNRDERHPERFSFALFGEPAPSGTWAFRLIGHHLVISAVIADDTLVTVTPTAFSSHPNRMLGQRQALMALREEDVLARRLVGELTGATRTATLLGTEPIWDIVTVPGKERSLTKREGLPVGDLPAAPYEMALAVIDAFTAEHLRAPFQAAARERMRAAAQGAFFMAAGNPETGKPLYYRFHADTFLIEFACVDEEAQHLHTILHEF
jgi:hypothetical protein